MATVRVRIAVAVDSTGHWNACGWSGSTTEAEMMMMACETAEPGEARYFLTADLEIPEAKEVSAEVAPA